MSPFYFFLSAAVVLFALELGIFQLSVFWFFFAALGASVTAGICWFFPETGWTMAIAYFAIATALVVAVLFPALRRHQQKGGAMAGNDAVGQRVVVLENMEPGAVGRVQWSGRDWEARLEPDAIAALAENEEAVISAIEGIRLSIRPAR